ncbi:MDR transporter [Suhomyces tanzawaensis NRRL Y-17324]|uniref:MDR transporter n=1 Tax=Suhomyces tanzawaensis NRRL Y-17324 TaxID=984487 RepID=A0A1E4SQI3_9ASCO|nr:MDR transporter [Suhomyces tanzawaensis NRRL Y-17324]ODV81672.1 MDR transporter [Suhomyces tanzawaensis NRRL Y-17324]
MSEAPKQKYYESNAGDGSRATDQHHSGLPLALTLISCVASLFIVALDQTIGSIIITEVGERFHSFEKVGWLTTAFILPLATLYPSYGKLSIALGRKVLVMIGIVVFMVGLLVCGMASSMNMLIGGRAVQGVGAGAVQSMVGVIMTESVPISKRALAYTLIGVTFSVASVLGPFVGGALASKVSWRWCFYINLPIGGLALTLFFFGFNPPKPVGSVREKLAKIDYVGTFFLTAGLVLFLLGLSFGGVEFPWKSAAVICCLVLGPVLMAIFMVWNFRFAKNPIILTELLVIPQIIAACISASFNFAFFMVYIVFLSIYFQVIFNASAYQSGIDMLPLVIVVSVSSMLNGVYIKFTRDVKSTMVFSGILAPIGGGLLLLLSDHSPVRDRIGLLIISGFSVGLQFQSSMLAAQLMAPPDVEGSLILVTILLNFLKSTLSTIAISVAQLLFQNTGATYLADTINSLDPSSLDYQILSKIPPKAILSSPRLINLFPPSTRQLVIRQFMRALKNTFYFGLGLACVSFVASVFCTNRRIPKDEDVLKKEDHEKKEMEDERMTPETVDTSKDSETSQHDRVI